MSNNCCFVYFDGHFYTVSSNKYFSFVWKIVFKLLRQLLIRSIVTDADYYT